MTERWRWEGSGLEACEGRQKSKVARRTFRVARLGGGPYVSAIASFVIESGSAVDDGFEVGFAAEDQGGADHLNELLAAKVREKTRDRLTR
jgi:hypothetical protein